LGWNFFGLSSEYSRYLIDEFYYLAKTMNIQYSEFTAMPTYVRRYLMDKVLESYKNNT
jgi:hypothetical protein